MGLVCFQFKSSDKRGHCLSEKIRSWFREFFCSIDRKHAEKRARGTAEGWKTLVFEKPALA